MNTEDFREVLAVGERVARQFMLNFFILTNTRIFNVHDIQAWRIEGSDFVVEKLEWIKEDVDAEFTNWFVESGIRLNNECLRPRLIHGGVEAKGTSPGKLIERNDLGSCVEAVVPFALWDGNEQDDCCRTKYTRETHGSTRRFFQPDWTPPSWNNEKRFSSEPLILAHIFECLDNLGHPRPYASVVFEDFPALKKRLIQYAGANGLDLTDWNSIPTGEAAKNFQCGNLIIPPHSNMWYVPLSVLADLARITLIGDPPMFYRNGSCTVEMQKMRYQSLCDHAAAFVPAEHFKLDGEIGAYLHNHAISNLFEQSTIALKGKLQNALGKYIDIDKIDYYSPRGLKENL